jgi:hypothetical protein
MFWPAGYKPALAVLRAAQTHLEREVGFERGTQDLQRKAFELCAQVLSRSETLSVVFLDGRVFRVEPSVFLQTIRADYVPTNPFLLLDANLEVTTSKARSLLAMRRQKVRKFVLTPSGFVRTFKMAISDLLGRPVDDSGLVQAFGMRGPLQRYADAVKSFEGCPIILDEAEFPTKEGFQSLLGVDPVSNTRNPGRPALVPLVVTGLREAFPDGPADLPRKELLRTVAAFLGRDVSLDTLDRARRDAWPADRDAE